MAAPQPIPELAVGDLLDRIAGGAGAPAGAVAAVTVAAAAGLVTMVARASKEVWAEAGGVAAQSEALRARVTPLAQRNADAYARAVGLLAAPVDASGRPRDGELGLALREAAAVPSSIAAIAADVAELADQASRSGAPRLRPDAQAAAALAHAAAVSTERLVAANLMVTGDDDPVLHEARRAVEDAGRAQAAAAEV